MEGVRMMEKSSVKRRVRDLLEDAYSAGYEAGYSKAASDKEMDRLRRNAELLVSTMCCGGRRNVVMPDDKGGRGHYEMRLTGYDAEPVSDEYDVIDEDADIS